MQVMTDTRERLIDRVFISGANALSYAFLPLPQQEEEAKRDRDQTERALWTRKNGTMYGKRHVPP